MDGEVARLRAEQVGSFIAGDLTRYFDASDRLAAASSGFACSYECGIHTVLHALHGLVADARALRAAVDVAVGWGG